MKGIFVLLFFSIIMAFKTAHAQDYPSPLNLVLDTLSLRATWEAPRRIALDETFENPLFPPLDWQDTTLGTGWQVTTNGSSQTFNIPPHTSYAFVNNELNGSGLNACCDKLISPEMNLSQSQHFTLSFQSFFPGQDAETASIEISTDGGETWLLLTHLSPHFTWSTFRVDLSDYSGQTGFEHIKIAFAANDNGDANATGWAIDDILIISEQVDVNSYMIFFDGTIVSETSDTTFCIPPIGLEMYTFFCIEAMYDSGYSDLVCTNFPSFYLEPPSNLEVQIIGGSSSFANLLHWSPPGNSNTNLLSYNIYRNNSFLINIPGTDSIYQDTYLDPGSFCYQISAVYDLTPFGFPYQTGESQLAGPACVDIIAYTFLPFSEDWATGQFDVNLWTVGANWVMDHTDGNPAPAVKFNSLPQQTNYTSDLKSYFVGAINQSQTPHCLILDFDYFLDDNSASGTEKLNIEFSFDNTTWTRLGSISNNGEMGWTHQHFTIPQHTGYSLLRIKFIANGVDSQLINYWLVDNIEIYYEYGFTAPANLTAIPSGSAQQNDIQLSWDTPQWEKYTELIQDDSTWENSLTINSGYTAWLGNKFTATNSKLRTADLMWISNMNSSNSALVLDVFDADRKLTGSSGSFIPSANSWQTINFPDIKVDGYFYIMVRFNGQQGITDLLGMDSTTLSGRPNNGWYFDGTNWSQLNTFGFDEGVFSIRATTVQLPDCESGDNLTPDNKSGNILNSVQNKKSTQSYSGLLDFTVFRREYQIPIPGQDSLLTEWQNIATVTNPNYLDADLEYKCFQYYVQAKYNEGYSLPSNIEESCFLEGIPEPETSGITIYPNPANDLVTIETNSNFNNLSVFNVSGRKTDWISFTGMHKVTLDVSAYSSGIYTMVFTTEDGKMSFRKLIKM